MISDPAIMVISGYNTRAVVAFCRWAQQHDIAYHIVAQGETDPIFHTEYRDKVAIVRSSKALAPREFTGWLLTLRERYRHERIVILPSTEYLNRFMLQYRSGIEAAGGIVPLVSQELYARLSDKYAFAETCSSFGLHVPKEYPQLPEQFPFVAKPLRYTSAGGTLLAPALIFCRQDLAEFNRKDYANNYFFQEFIHGKSYYLLAYIGRDGQDVRFSQENLMQQAGGGSILLARSSEFHNCAVAESYLDMLKALGFYGMVMVEVRYEQSQGRYYMIEANPRLWGPIQFSLDNQVDFFGAMLEDFGFDLPKREGDSEEVSHYFWSGGFSGQAQPISYHNYSGEQFSQQYSSIRECDIFLREDSLHLHYHEAKMACDNE